MMRLGIRTLAVIGELLAELVKVVRDARNAR
jgi:hypothetical protein